MAKLTSSFVTQEDLDAMGLDYIEVGTFGQEGSKIYFPTLGITFFYDYGTYYPQL